MQTATLNGTTLEYEVKGSGEPVVFIHGALIADTFEPLLREPALKDFRLIRYRRQGHGGSSRPDGLLTVAKQAADCIALLERLDATPAHVVGHSGGGVIAIQLALDVPEAVRSLALLEPALLDVPSGPQLAEDLAPVVQTYQAGDKAAAVDRFLQAVCGKEYRAALDAAVPGGFEQAVSDADIFFGAEFPTAGGEWWFTRENAARIKQPVLAVLGANSDAVWPGWGEGHQRLLEWLPQAKPFVLPRAAHSLEVENPHDMAEGLAAFLTTNRRTENP